MKLTERILELGKTTYCPKCDARGTVQIKAIKNNQGRVYRYAYFAHSEGRKGNTGKLSWCYLGSPALLPNSDGREEK